MKDSEYQIEDFWLPADGDNWAPAIMRAQTTVPVYGPMTLYVSNRLINLSSRVDIIRPAFTIKGNKQGFSVVSAVSSPEAPIPTLKFTVGGTAGFVTHYPGTYVGGTYGSLVVPSDSAARSEDFTLEGVTVEGPSAQGNNGLTGAIDDHGINAHFRFHLRDVCIRGFRGAGIYGNASVGSSTNLGNINGSSLTRLAIYYCGGPAIDLSGGDANQITMIGPININDCGTDMASRFSRPTTIVAGRRTGELTITTAVGSTLYRVVVEGTNCDYTSPSGSPSKATIAAGVAAAVVSAAVANVTAAQIDSDRVLIYGTNNSTFTCTESSSNMTLVLTSQTTTPTSAHCIGGAASTELKLGDTCSCWMPGEAWSGFLRGDVVDIGEGYGYHEIDLALERTAHGADSISQVSGSTWQLILSDGRAWTAPEHTGRTIAIRGATAAANSGSFPTTAIASGIHGPTSVRLRVSYAQASSLYWVRIRGNTSGGMTLVSVTSAASPTVGSIRDQLVTAISAAGITGVSVAATSSADLIITCTGVIAQPGPRMDNVGQGLGELAWTVIEYTNASAVADTSFDGSWEILNNTAVQGGYSPVGGALVFGRGCQVQDQPLIENKLSNIQISGSTYGDGFVSKNGRSIFDQCYTEGPLQAISVGLGASFNEGSMYPGVATKAKLTSALEHSFQPSVSVSHLPPSLQGSVIGRLGDTNSGYSNSAGGFEYKHDGWGDVWRWMWEQTAQGRGSWELVLQALSEMVAIRLGTMRDKRMGVGGVATGQAGIFTNYADGAIRPPRSAIGDGANGINFTNDSDNTGATGYIGEYRQNGNYKCRVDTLGVWYIASITAAIPPSVNIGTHNLAAGHVGRCIVRNAQGISTNVLGDHQFTRTGTATVSLQDLSGSNITSTGTHTSSSGLLIQCRLVASGFVAGTALSLSSGNWIVGDRFINIAPASGSSHEWICVTTGVGTNAVWESVSQRP